MLLAIITILAILAIIASQKVKQPEIAYPIPTNSDRPIIQVTKQRSPIHQKQCDRPILQITKQRSPIHQKLKSSESEITIKGQKQ